MNNENGANGNMDKMLIRESIWQIEDKVNIIQESIADHEAELIRLKRLTALAKERIDKIDAQKGINPNNR